MNALIDASFPKPEFIEKARFGFLQRLRILQALRADADFHALAEALEVLNEIRNSLAHQLEPAKPETLIPLFIEAAFNSVGRNAKPLGVALRQPDHAKARYSRVALGQAVAIVVGRLAHLQGKIGP